MFQDVRTGSVLVRAGAVIAYTVCPSRPESDIKLLHSKEHTYGNECCIKLQGEILSLS